MISASVEESAERVGRGARRERTRDGDGRGGRRHDHGHGEEEGDDERGARHVGERAVGRPPRLGDRRLDCIRHTRVLGRVLEPVRVARHDGLELLELLELGLGRRLGRAPHGVKSGHDVRREQHVVGAERHVLDADLGTAGHGVPLAAFDGLVRGLGRRRRHVGGLGRRRRRDRHVLAGLVLVIGEAERLRHPVGEVRLDEVGRFSEADEVDAVAKGAEEVTQPPPGLDVPTVRGHELDGRPGRLAGILGFARRRDAYVTPCFLQSFMRSRSISS